MLLWTLLLTLVGLLFAVRRRWRWRCCWLVGLMLQTLLLRLSVLSTLLLLLAALPTLLLLLLLVLLLSTPPSTSVLLLLP